jgi:hypothetical protein
VIKKDNHDVYAKSFANGNERKMKEILKTPGVEVDKNVVTVYKVKKK